ncbi:MAG TPA: glycosyltransferase [Patescibacteria group bacterium]
MKVALVHDYLAQDGGAEKVLKVFQEIFPGAPTFVLVHNKDKANPIFLKKDIRTSFIQKMPLGVKKYQWFLPLMPLATEKYNLKGYDLVLSSSSAFSNGVLTGPQTLHICYCHTPTRFLWSDTHEYVQELKYNRLVKKIVPLLLTRLRLWDRQAADRVDRFIANSATVQQRIKKYYRRQSDIINPPVETDIFNIAPATGDYFLTGGRLVSYKRFDITVQAFSRLGVSLKIFGIGPAMEDLKKIAKDNIEFLGQITDAEKAELYGRALAFIHPQEEDFGITPIESMASGRPVIAYAAGGALETVIAGQTGEFFKEQTWEELADLVIRFDKNRYNPEQIRSHALKYNVDSFKTKIKDYIDKSLLL